MLIPDQNSLNKFNQHARSLRIPLTLMMELTPRCSLDCKMCYVHLTREQMGDRKELTAEQWKSVLDQAIEMGTMSVLMTGGECLMHKDFKEIYLYVLSKPVLLSLNTNATLINDDYIDFFAKNPPHRIKISLYGSSEEGYERVTGHRMYARVRDNILKLKNVGINIKIAITVCKQSYDEAMDIVKFARDNHIEYSVDMAMYEAAEGTGRSSDDYSLTPEETAAKYLELKKLEGLPCFENEPTTEIPERLDNGEEVRGLQCGAGRTTCTVCWDGDLQPCLINKMGNTVNILDVSFKEGWERATQIVEEQLRPIECMTCKYAIICNPCSIYRSNPKDPGHCNPKVCKITLAKLNAGVSRLLNEEEAKKYKAKP